MFGVSLAFGSLWACISLNGQRLYCQGVRTLLSIRSCFQTQQKIRSAHMKRGENRCVRSASSLISFTLPSTRSATSKILATTIRLSSFVSESSCRSASSMSVLPISFFRNFSRPKSDKKEHRTRNGLLIRLSVIAFVESARMERVCAMIFPSNSVNSLVSGIIV
jgi:hypothetical protein